MKPWYKSRTFWASVIGAVVSAAAILDGAAHERDWYTAAATLITSVATGVLRYLDAAGAGEPK